MSVALGPTASAAGKSIICSGNTCLLYGANSQTIGNGIVGVLTFQLAGGASGNLAVQLGSASAASSAGDSIPVGTTGGVIAVTGSSVSVAVSPNVVSLGASQTQQFTATVSGGSGNTAVSWTLSPNVGTISSTGLYTAPATITTQQSVVVKATSVADTTKSANANVTLRAGVSVGVSPATASLSAGQTQQFTATVSGGSGNTAVSWTLSPNVGTISSTGLYIAPATITTQQSVVVKATSVADTTKSASATLTLLPPGSVTSLWNLGPHRLPWMTVTPTQWSWG